MKKVARAVPRLGEFIPTMQPSYATIPDTLEAHGGMTWAEIKYDGYRMQVHRGKSLLKIFTRNGNELNYRCYPDVMHIAEQLPTCIIEAELVADGNNHKETFDLVKKRFRRQGIKQESVEKYLKSDIVSDVPLGLRVFDALRFERKGLLHLPFDERTGYTELFDIGGLTPVEHEIITGCKDLEGYIDSAFSSGQEGVVCKNPESTYDPGSRTLDWVKFKRSETLDLVVVGTYRNEELDLPFSSVLVAAYNAQTGLYETLGKVGTTREEFARDIDGRIRSKATGARPANVRWSEKLDRDSYARHVPHRYVDPEQSVVLEVKAMNLNYSRNWQTCGLDDGRAFSMRIGWVAQLRPDKSPRQATTTDTIRTLYELQQGGGG